MGRKAGLPAAAPAEGDGGAVRLVGTGQGAFAARLQAEMSAHREIALVGLGEAAGPDVLVEADRAGQGCRRPLALPQPLQLAVAVGPDREGAAAGAARVDRPLPCQLPDAEEAPGIAGRRT